jgi:hypothetical protein
MAKREIVWTKISETQLQNIIEDYIIFYEILEDRILILKIWDCRQNPDNLTIQR